MTDREILIWIHQRLVSVHGENEFYDYMHKLREVIYRMPKDRRGGTVVTMDSDIVLEEIRKIEDGKRVNDNTKNLVKEPD